MRGAGALFMHKIILRCSPSHIDSKLSLLVVLNSNPWQYERTMSRRFRAVRYHENRLGYTSKLTGLLDAKSVCRPQEPGRTSGCESKRRGVAAAPRFLQSIGEVSLRGGPVNPEARIRGNGRESNWLLTLLRLTKVPSMCL